MSRVPYSLETSATGLPTYVPKNYPPPQDSTPSYPPNGYKAQQTLAESHERLQLRVCDLETQNEFLRDEIARLERDLKDREENTEYYVTKLQTQNDTLQALVDTLEEALKKQDKRVSALEAVFAEQQAAPRRSSRIRAMRR